MSPETSSNQASGSGFFSPDPGEEAASPEPSTAMVVEELLLLLLAKGSLEVVTQRRRVLVLDEEEMGRIASADVGNEVLVPVVAGNEEGLIVPVGRKKLRGTSRLWCGERVICCARAWSL